MGRVKGRLLLCSVALALAALAVGAAPSGAVELPTEKKCEFIASPGQQRVHAAVPGRLLHEGRPDEPDRASHRLPRTGDARQRGSPAHRSRAVQQRRRLQSRLGDRAEGSRASKPPPTSRRCSAVPINALRPLQEGQRAGRRDRRQHRGTLADLGRDRLDGRSRRRRTSRSTRPSTSPPGDRYIVALREPQERDKDTPAGARRLPRLPRQPAFVRRKGQRTARRTSKKSSRSSKAPGSRGRACTSRGTSRSQATRTTPAASSRCATGRSPRSATTTSQTASSKGSRRRSP